TLFVDAFDFLECLAPTELLPYFLCKMNHPLCTVHSTEHLVHLLEKDLHPVLEPARVEFLTPATHGIRVQMPPQGLRRYHRQQGYPGVLVQFDAAEN
ncbi:MAG: hypothetical protein JXA89_11600, partial [Anaerolineae bacterium]|nr:hypothetical protein [Anaerolineae bacterium]